MKTFQIAILIIILNLTQSIGVLAVRVKIDRAGDHVDEHYPSMEALITAPKVSSTMTDGVVNVSIEIQNVTAKLTKNGAAENVSSGVYDLRLFRDGQLVGSSAPRELIEKYIRDAPKLVEEGIALGAQLNTPEDKAWREANDLAKVVKFDASGKATYTFKDIKLPRDGRTEVEFSAYAFNSDRVKSETVRTIYKIEKPTIVKGKTYLVSIGVNASESEEFRLDFAANDATKMQEILPPRLAVSGQALVKIPLISDYDPATKITKDGNAATKSIIKGVFELLAGGRDRVSSSILSQIPNADAIEVVQPEDTVIITYSGHGYVDRSGIFYLLPFDIGRSTSKLTPEILPNLISSDELSLWMRDITGREMIMVIDACHSAAAVQGPDFKPGPMGSRGLGQLAYDKGIKILSATQAGNVALELNSLRMGLLTFALLEDGIKLAKADTVGPDKKLTTQEWLSYGEARVPSLYEDIRAGKYVTSIDGKRRSDPVDLLGDNSGPVVQTPKLFDFTRKRSDVALLSLE